GRRPGRPPRAILHQDGVRPVRFAGRRGAGSRRVCSNTDRERTQGAGAPPEDKMTDKNTRTGKPVLDYPCGEPPAPGQAREIAPGVLWLRMPLPFSLTHINLWAVRDGDGWAVFDTGVSSEKTSEAWRELVGA